MMTMLRARVARAVCAGHHREFSIMRNAGFLTELKRGLSSIASRRGKAKHSRKGAAAVELALIAPIFFMLIVGVVEMTMMMTAQQLMESAAYNTSRLAKTGYVTSGMTQMQTVSQVLNRQLESFGTFIDMSHVTMTAKAYSTFASIGSGQGSEGLGTAEQIVVYTINYPWKLVTPMLGSLIGSQDAYGNWIVNLQSRIVVRNEPYS